MTSTLHFTAPVGVLAWRWLHLVLEQLTFVLILLAANWFGWRGMLLTTSAASLLFAIHVLIDWRGFVMVQADELGVLATFWLVAVVSARIFEGQRRAREDVRAAHAETLGALAGALELREHDTAGHSGRVRAYALMLANEVGLSEAGFLADLGQGALLHDIGKLGIPDRILLKPGPLSADEWSLMHEHPDVGTGLVGDIGFLRPIRELVRAHHERFDGGGYPRGLRGEEIPLGARIFSVADALDALTTDRPYRRAVSFEEALDRLRPERGLAFDPAVVDALVTIPRNRWATAATTCRQERSPREAHAGTSYAPNTPHLIRVGFIGFAESISPAPEQQKVEECSCDP